MINNFGLKGKLNIKVLNKKDVIKEYNYENLITNAGMEAILKMVGGEIIGGINRIGLGSGSTPANINDTTLNNKLVLVNVNKDYTDVDRVNFLGTVPENSFTTTQNYLEAGLFYKNGTQEILITRMVFDDVVYQNPANSLSLSYSLELKRGV
jgi:hypothetical protein